MQSEYQQKVNQKGDTKNCEKGHMKVEQKSRSTSDMEVPHKVATKVGFAYDEKGAEKYPHK